MSTGRQCGSCTLCCKVMRIAELDKLDGVWCQHCAIGKGCGIYEERPESCRAFMCQWLMDPEMPEALRPDKSKVVVFIQLGGKRLVARCDPATPTAWRREPFYSRLKQVAQKANADGREVLAFAGSRCWVIGPHEDIDLGEVPLGTVVRIQRLSEGRMTATVVPAVNRLSP